MKVHNFPKRALSTHRTQTKSPSRRKRKINFRERENTERSLQSWRRLEREIFGINGGRAKAENTERREREAVCRSSA